jgi:hypothetical protein
VAASGAPAHSEALAAAAPGLSVPPEANATQAQATTSNPIPSPQEEVPREAAAAQAVPVAPQVTCAPNVEGSVTGLPKEDLTQGQGAVIQPKDKKQLASDRVQNPHDPEATYSVKGQGEKKKEHVGYKVQVAETVCEADLTAGEPTRNFITGIVTHPAYESDQAGALKMEAEQAAMGLDKPPVQYVDAAYVSAQKLVQAQAEGREMIGPALPGPQKDGRFSAADFQVNVEERQAICPAGKASTQCSRLVQESTGKGSYRFEFSTQCHACPLRAQCVGKGQRHRSLVVGEYHTVLQARRQEQQTPAFQQRMKHRNAIEGTQSELVRAHGLRRARYRGLAKAKLQNYFIGAACNIKRWIRREAWKLRQAMGADAGQMASATAQ